MHVLFIPSWYPLNANDLNGCFFREQAHAISRSGIKTGVIVPQFRSLRLGREAIFNSYKEEFWYDNGINTYFMHNVFFFPKVPYLDQWRWAKKGMELFETYIKNHGMPDLLHVQSMILGGALALEISKQYDIPYCITEHSSTFARNLVSPWQYKTLQTSVDNASHCMAVSQDLCNLLTRRFLESNWEFCPNLLNPLFERNQSIIPKKKERQFCAVANLNKNKAIDNLLVAFSEVLKNHPDYTLTIAGDGPEARKLRLLAKNLKISQSVSFLGHINRMQVKELMAESFCYVLSSHVETFGVVVIEALSQGTPVVSTKCGGPESILTSNKDGLLVKADNVNDLANGMLHMIDNKKLYDSKDIRKRCIERFSEKSFISKMSKKYKQCINKKT